MRQNIVRALAVAALLLVLGATAPAAPVSAGAGSSVGAQFDAQLANGECGYAYNAGAGNFLVGRKTQSGLLRLRSASTPPASCRELQNIIFP